MRPTSPHMIHRLFRTPAIFLFVHQIEIISLESNSFYPFDEQSFKQKFQLPSLNSILRVLHFLYDPLCNAHKLCHYLHYFHLVSLEFFRLVVSIGWWIRHQFLISSDMVIRIYRSLPIARSPLSAPSISVCKLVGQLRFVWVKVHNNDTINWWWQIDEKCVLYSPRHYSRIIAIHNLHSLKQQL